MRSQQGMAQAAFAKAADEIHHTSPAQKSLVCSLDHRGPFIQQEQGPGTSAGAGMGGWILAHQSGEQSLLTGKTSETQGLQKRSMGKVKIHDDIDGF
ncbi:hypothetical protein BGE01nite_15720 [Brevifollis gellanilyticus]|uniref:Uncharacterized protein n=1 Tax=Brevifollis gellanilyticus TaxID=748831 RepID=A0A512M7G4_9BACT|nr:hypothetical protein BGE01nite_15720 [Brevifollis gellanilyticus]